jgi:hypothetical protein
MRYNIKINLAVMATALSLLSGCGWVKDSPKATQAFQAKAFDLHCMDRTPEKLQNLFAGNYTGTDADKAEIRSIWSCLDKGLNTFSAYTRGTDPNYYNSTELQQFANRYLPQDKPLDPTFIKAIFRLKMAVIGGSDSSINRIEIDRLRKKLNRFGQIIEPLAPHLHVLLSPASTTTDLARKDASIHLNTFVLNLADVLGDSTNAVMWSDLLNFVFELELYTKKGQKSALTFLREELPLFQYFKLLIVGGSDSSIEQNKWNPIFQSISHVYDAISLTSTHVELLQNLGFTIESNEEEQKRAVSILIEQLKVLKADTTLQSHDTIATLSDRFAQLLLLNNVLFPRSAGSLALKPFLSTESMRTLTGYILDEIPAITVRNADQQSHLQKIVEDVTSLLDQAAISNSIPGTLTPSLSLSALQDYAQILRPLFKKDTDADKYIAAIKTLRDAIPVIIGRDADHLTPKDLKNLIHKGLDAYLVWGGFAPKEVFEKIGASLDILNREPVASTIVQSQVLIAIDDISETLQKFEIVTTANWPNVKLWVQKGFSAKALLFQNSANSVSSYELNQLAYLYDPLRRNSDLPVAMAAMSNLLSNRPFADVKIADLLSTINTFMGSSNGLSTLGIDANVLGDIKVLLAGGSKTLITGQEYAGLTRALAAIYARLETPLKELPKDFHAGINSTSFGIAEAAIQGFIEGKRDPIVLTDLRTFMIDLFKTSPYKVRESTLNATLEGIYTRILMASKGAKPTSIEGLKISSDKLAAFLPGIEGIRSSLLDLETAYGVADLTTTTLSRATLLARVQSPSNALIIKKIQPLLEGKIHELNLPKRGAPRDLFYEYDLAYKSVIYNVTSWVMPYYKIAVDDQAPSLRLNKDDLIDLLTDINDLVFDLKLSLSNSTPAASAKARMSNMNLFTQIGNGDPFMDPLEAVEFLTFTAGGQILLGQVEEKILKECFAPGTNIGDVARIPIQCLNRVVFTKDFMQKFYGPVIPLFVDQYMNFSSADLENYRKAALTTTRAGWTDTSFMEIGDLETFVALPYFLENIFERLDVNFDDTLRFSELMSGFPVFCQQIKDATGGSLKGSCVRGEDPKQVEAIYGYMIYNGHPPTGTEPGTNIFRRLRAYAEILAWFNHWKHLNRDPLVRDTQSPAIGRQDLLSILSNLSASTSDSAASPQDAPDLPE